MQITTELRAAWQSLSEAEGDAPGHDYDRGYLTGWYDVRRGLRRIRPRGTFRDPERVADFRLGYRDGRRDGAGRSVDWWPDFARGRKVRALAPETPQDARNTPGQAPDTIHAGQAA